MEVLPNCISHDWQSARLFICLLENYLFIFIGFLWLLLLLFLFLWNCIHSFTVDCNTLCPVYLRNILTFECLTYVRPFKLNKQASNCVCFVFCWFFFILLNIQLFGANFFLNHFAWIFSYWFLFCFRLCIYWTHFTLEPNFFKSSCVWQNAIANTKSNSQFE